MKNRILSLLLALSIALPGTLSAAALLSPTPARAAGTATAHYSFKASGNWETDHNRLHTNLWYGHEALRSSAIDAFGAGTMYLPAGTSAAGKTFRLYNSVGTKTYTYNETTKKYTFTSVSHGKELAEDQYHYGLPYRYCTNDAGTVYYKAATESMEITLQDWQPLDTTDIQAANVSMVIIQYPTSYGLNIPLDRRLEVKVSLDGESWLDGFAGVRSATLLAGGVNGTTDAQYFRIETENLLDIPGVAGNTIKGIKLLPEGADVCSTGTLSINELQINTYETLADFDRLAPADEITTTKTADSLRDIAVAEAVRTASQQWTSDAEISIYSPSGSSSGATTASGRIYSANTTYRGPVYERSSDSSRELFQSLLGDGKYDSNEAKLVTSTLEYDKVYTSEHPYGMDCQTFVFNAISRVSRTNAWAVAFTPWATRVTLRDGLAPLTHPAYTDNDIIDPTVATLGEQAVYQHYTTAQPGDVAIHFLSNDNNSVHTRLVKEVYVKKNGSSIDPDSSYMRFTEQTGSFIYAYTPGNGTQYSTSSPSSYLYNLQYISSSRTGEEQTHSFSDLLEKGYVIYTLDEYETNEVEDVRVQAVAGSKTAKTDFVTGGISIAVSSNYRIISHRVKLNCLRSGVTLFDSGLQYNIDPFPSAFNYQDDELDVLLKNLPSGKYAITMSVDSGPFTSLSQTTVPTTDKVFEFTVDGDNFCDTGSDGTKHESEYGWTQLNTAWFAGRTQSSNGFYTLPSGKYCLTEDLTVPNNGILNIIANDNVILCLNGHDLKLLPTSNYSNNSIQINNGALLTLCDCCGTGTIQAGDSETSRGTNDEGVYAILLAAGGQLDMYGGSITNTYARYGSVYINGNQESGLFGVVNMYGGSITGNTAPEHFGGISMINGAVFNMYGGTISNNSGPQIGSGIYMTTNCTATIYDGTVSACEGPSAVFVTSGSTLTMSGGSITENTCTQYPAVYVANGTFTMTGGMIYGNDVPDELTQVGYDLETGSFVQTGGTIIENFQTCSVTVADAVNGTVTVDKASGREGEIVTVSATPNEGYYLKAIQVDGTTISGSTFPLSGDHTVTASFAKIAAFYGVNIDLGSTLDMNFYIARTSIIDPGSYAKVVRTFADGREDHVHTLYVSDWTKNGAYYQITYKGLAAKEMCDEISVTIYNSAGTAISETRTESMRSYVMRALANSTDPIFHTALVDMLNYGAAAQVNFTYSTGDLANSQLTTEQQALATQSVSIENIQDSTGHLYGYNLDLESRIRLNFYFTDVTDDMYATVSYTSHSGEGKSYRVEDADFFKNKSTYQARVNDLAVADGNTLVTCTVYKADGSVHAQVTDSMNSYVARALDAGEKYQWMESIAKFSASAYNYLRNR